MILNIQQYFVKDNLSCICLTMHCSVWVHTCVGRKPARNVLKNRLRCTVAPHCLLHCRCEGGDVQCRWVFVTELGGGGNVGGMRWGITGFSRSTFDLGFNPQFSFHFLNSCEKLSSSTAIGCTCAVQCTCTNTDLQFNALQRNQRILLFHFHHQIRFQFGSTTSIPSFAIIELLSSSLNLLSFNLL